MDPDLPRGLAETLEEALLARRIILVNGSVDHDRGGRLAAALMTLDALGDDPIELRLNAGSESLDVALALIDTIDALGVYINATVAASVWGTMAGVLAVCNHRRIGPLGSITLSEPHGEYEGRATDLARHASELESRLDQYVRRLVAATGRPLEHLEADIQSGRRLDAQGALDYGIVDEVLRH